MIHRNLKQMAMALIAIYTISACSGGDLAGGGAAEKKDPKKKRTEGETTQDSETSNDASQPQVVTGAYLACIEDGSAPSGNTNFGCTVTNEKDHKKMDLKGKTLNITAADPSGQLIPSQFKRDAESSAFHGHVSVASGAASTAKFTAEIDGKLVKDLKRINFEWEPLPKNLDFILISLSKAFGSIIPLNEIVSAAGNGKFITLAGNLKAGKSGFSQSEVAAWCSQSSIKSQSTTQKTEAILGAACGADKVTQKDTAAFLGKVKYFQTGICETSTAVGPNMSTFSDNCKNP